MKPLSLIAWHNTKKAIIHKSLEHDFTKSRLDTRLFFNPHKTYIICLCRDEKMKSYTLQYSTQFLIYPCSFRKSLNVEVIYRKSGNGQKRHIHLNNKLYILLIKVNNTLLSIRGYIKKTLVLIHAKKKKTTRRTTAILQRLCLHSLILSFNMC